MKGEDNKLPKSALALYVKLYCKKKGCSSNKQNLLVEATKSWVSLSKEDKQYFKNALKEQELKLRKKFALSLQNAQPYLKRKHIDIRSPKLNTDLDTEIKKETQVFSVEDQVINEQSYSPVFHENHQHNDQLENCNTIIPFESEHSAVTQDNTILSPQHCNLGQNDVMFIPEPTPPMRSSMELYDIIKRNEDIIKSNEESSQSCNWADLSKSQKRRYQRALQTIKCDYIKQYTAYLEQMTPEQLFYYYKSKF